jgi:hypothetical protein
MFHPSRPDVLLLWGAEWIASYDPHALSETNHQLIKQKFRRRSSGTTTCGNVSVCSKYSPLVFVGAVAPLFHAVSCHLVARRVAQHFTALLLFFFAAS